MSVTIKAIAERAGVHPSTVDKVLHNREGVSPKVRLRIQELVDEMGYKPNPIGIVLQRQGKPIHIAAVLVKVDALKPLQEGIEQGAVSSTGIEVNIRHFVTSFQDAEKQAKILSQLIDEKIDGIIVSPINSDLVRKEINRAQRKGIPVVTTNSDIDGTRRLCYVGQDGVRASRTAGRMMGLFLQGHGKIAIISSAISSENNNYYVHVREQEFRSFLASKYPDIEILDVIESYEDPQVTYTETVRLLHEHPDLDGIYITCGGVTEVGRAVIESGRAAQLKIVSFEAYPHILKLMREDVVDCTLGSEMHRQGSLPVQIIVEYLMFRHRPEKEQMFTDIRVFVKECLL